LDFLAFDYFLFLISIRLKIIYEKPRKKQELKFVKYLKNLDFFFLFFFKFKKKLDKINKIKKLFIKKIDIYFF